MRLPQDNFNLGTARPRNSLPPIKFSPLYWCPNNCRKIYLFVLRHCATYQKIIWGDACAVPFAWIEGFSGPVFQHAKEKNWSTASPCKITNLENDPHLWRECRRMVFCKTYPSLDWRKQKRQLPRVMPYPQIWVVMTRNRGCRCLDILGLHAYSLWQLRVKIVNYRHPPTRPSSHLSFRSRRE